MVAILCDNFSLMGFAVKLAQGLESPDPQEGSPDQFVGVIHKHVLRGGRHDFVHACIYECCARRPREAC